MSKLRVPSPLACTTQSSDDVSWRHRNAGGTMEFPEAKRYRLFRCCCGLQIRQTSMQWTTAYEAYCKERFRNAHHWSQTSHRSGVDRADSRRRHGGSLQLCVSGVVVFQLVRWSFRALLLILTLCFRDSCDLWSLCWMVEPNGLVNRSDFLAMSALTLVVLIPTRVLNIHSSLQ